MENATRVTFLSMLLTTTMLSPVHGEEQKSVTSLDTVTVHATPIPQDVPAIVSTVDVDAPGNPLAGDVGDLLKFTPGVEVGKGPRRNDQTISIRGFDSDAVITLIDGRRQDLSSGHDGRFFVDPAMLKSVEVLKGASSAIRGSGAMGGVVAFETKDAADLLIAGETSGALTSFGWRSANNEYSPTVTAFGRARGWDLLGSVSYRHSGDIEQGDGNKLYAKDKVLSGLFKAGYTFNGFHALKFQAQSLNSDGQEPDTGERALSSHNSIVN